LRSNANTANPSKTYSFFPAEPDWLFCLSSPPASPERLATRLPAPEAQLMAGRWRAGGKAEAKKIHQKSFCLGALVAEYLPIFEILPAP